MKDHTQRRIGTFGVGARGTKQRDDRAAYRDTNVCQSGIDTNDQPRAVNHCCNIRQRCCTHQINRSARHTGHDALGRFAILRATQQHTASDAQVHQLMRERAPVFFAPMFLRSRRKRA